MRKNKLRRNKIRNRAYAIEIDDDNADAIDFDNVLKLENVQDADGLQNFKFNRKSSINSMNSPAKRKRIVSKRLPADDQESYISAASNMQKEAPKKEILSSSENDV